MAAGESDTRLRELEEIYRSAPVGLCLVDPEFRFLRINDRLAATPSTGCGVAARALSDQQV